jgi:hypothetical protein
MGMVHHLITESVDSYERKNMFAMIIVAIVALIFGVLYISSGSYLMGRLLLFIGVFLLICWGIGKMLHKGFRHFG